MLQLEDAAICREVIDSLELGILVVDRDHLVSFWSRGAEKITGYTGAEVLGRRCCDSNLCLHCATTDTREPRKAACPLNATIVDGEIRHTRIYLRHKMGHTVPVRAQTSVLRGAKGEVVGAVESFIDMQVEWDDAHDGIARMECVPLKADTPRSREDLERWLERSLEAIRRDHQPFGVLQIQVDQLPRLRVTHGREATEALMRMIAQTLTGSLHSSDIFGRWSDSGFLVIARDANARALELDADLLRTLAKSVVFRWWGDRIPVTASIGGAMATADDSPESILVRVTAALARGMAAGGDQAIVIEAGECERGPEPCL